MMTFWPWWLGSIALAVTAAAHLILFRRPFGVSSKWARVLFWRESRDLYDSSQAFDENADAMEAALMAATLKQFPELAAQMAAEGECGEPPPSSAGCGDDAPVDLGGCEGPASPCEAGDPPTASPGPAGRTHPIVHLLFLTGMVLGGLASQLSSGAGWSATLDLPGGFVAVFTSGLPGFLILLGGGVLVGFGTRMSGGCTSGHGLNGCACLRPGSMAATAAFFGTAIVVSSALLMMGRGA